MPSIIKSIIGTCVCSGKGEDEEKPKQVSFRGEIDKKIEELKVNHIEPIKEDLREIKTDLKIMYSSLQDLKIFIQGKK